MHQDKQSYSEMLITDEERALIEHKRGLVYPRLKRIAETVYEKLGYGEIVAEDPDIPSVHGNVGYLDISGGRTGICAAFNPNDTDKDRYSLEWPLSTDDDEIVGDLVAELREAAQHRRLHYVALRAAGACDNVDPDLLSSVSDDAIISAFVSAVTGS